MKELVAIRAALSELRGDYDDPHMRVMATIAIDAIQDCLPWLGEDPDPASLHEAYGVAWASVLGWDMALDTDEERAALRPHLEDLREACDSLGRDEIDQSKGNAS